MNIIRTMSREYLKNELVLFKQQKAKEIAKPNYYIFSSSCQIELINQIPQTKEEILKIKGFGKSKIHEFYI